MQEKKFDINAYIYYVLIFLISLAALVFLPLLGSEIGLGWKVPNTVAGWFVWVGTKAIVAILNVMIYHCFIQQGRTNAKSTAPYKEAEKLLSELARKEDKEVRKPRSPREFLGPEYVRKGIIIFVTTAMATVALTQAILSYDPANLMSYIFTIIMGILFGIIEMKKVEEYFTVEYLDYAHMLYNRAIEQPETSPEEETKVEHVEEPQGDELC